MTGIKKKRTDFYFYSHGVNDRFRRPVREHTIIVERAIGKELPKGSEVHHVNGNTKDNRNTNLVLCNNHGYHKILHERRRALDETGNVNYRRCTICKKFDDPNKLGFKKNNKQAWHLECKRKYDKEWRDKNVL